MSHDDHTVQLIKFEQAMVAKTKIKHYYSAHNITSTLNYSNIQSASGDSSQIPQTL